MPETILLKVAKDLVEKNSGSKKGKRLASKSQASTKEKLISRNGLGRKVIFEQAAKKTNQKTRGNYPAADAILDVIRHGLENGFDKGLKYEAQRFSELVMSDESKALRSIFFATTEMKKEHGADAEPNRVNRVGVLGGGLMGAGISHVSVAKAKVPVRIKDVSNDGVLNALNYNYKLFNKQKKRRILSRAGLESKMLQLSGGIDFTSFNHIDVVIEAVFEDLDLKQKMVADIEENAKPETILQLTPRLYQSIRLQRKQSALKMLSVFTTSALQKKCHWLRLFLMKGRQIRLSRRWLLSRRSKVKRLSL